MALTQVAGGMIASSQTITNPTLTTPIVSTTMGVGGATPAASGTGITFPATQSASSDANTLDDYEEGSWTPIYVSSGATITYNASRAARYTKIGNVVTIEVYLSTDGVSGRSTNVVLVGELPFPNINVGDIQPVAYVQSDSWGGTNYPMYCVIPAGSSRLYLFNQSRNSSGNGTQITSNDMAISSGGYNAFRVSLTYMTT